MQLAPIHLVVYKRLEHTKQAINALLTNSLAKDSVLIVSSDGAADGDEIDVENVRSYVRSVSGFKKIIINESKYNTLQERMRLPVKDSIDILEEYGRKITLEDDVVVAPHFLEYMNEEGYAIMEPNDISVRLNNKLISKKIYIDTSSRRSIYEYYLKQRSNLKIYIIIIVNKVFKNA